MAFTGLANCMPFLYWRCHFANSLCFFANLTKPGGFSSLLPYLHKTKTQLIRLGFSLVRVYFFIFFMHMPILAHLAGLGQPAQGLKGAFLAGAAFPAGFFPYIMVNLL
jgi:hypothetical protein